MDVTAGAVLPRETATEQFMRRAAEGRTVPGQRDEKLYEACVEFEALFIKQMLSAMRKSVEKSGLLDGGMAQDVFEDMLYDEYAKSMAKTAGFGLADTVYLHLTSVQRTALGAP